MSSIGSHLVDIRPLHSPDIADVVISRRESRVLSQYRDNVWDLDPYLPVKNLRQSTIRFHIALPDGSVLTDPQHARLLASAKRFLYMGWRIKAPHSRKYIAAKTVMNNWSQLRLLLKWMVSQGVGSFSALTPELCLAYATSQEGKLKSSTRVINLQILSTYYDLREHLVDNLPGYPWADTVPLALAGTLHGHRMNGQRQSTTEVIPPRILRLLVQKALDLIENRSAHLLDIRDHILHYKRDIARSLRITHRARYPQGFSSIYRDEDAYLSVRVSHLASQHINALCTEQGLVSHAEFKKQIIHLRTACYLICALFSGMRDAELASLEIGCFSRKEGDDGETFCWLRGLTYKLEADPMPAEWMVPDVVEKAVRVATRLGEPQRARCQARRTRLEAMPSEDTLPDAVRNALLLELDEARKHQYALMVTEREQGRILALSGCVAIACLRDFATLAGAIVEPPDVDGVSSHAAVSVGQPWPLASHQFRRTFAVYVAHHLMGDLRYLREHFKHWSMDMTLYYARQEGHDQALLADIISERDALQAVMMETWLATEIPLTGKGGKRLLAYRQRGEVKSVKNLRDFCRHLGDDVFIRGTGHSWCMASGRGCDGSGLYDALHCLSCDNALIDGTQRPIWREIRQQQIDVLHCHDLGLPSRARCLDHLREAERILRELGDNVEPYDISDAPFSGKTM